MNPGKVTCEELKKIRKMIADKNNIPYEITECKFSGKCSGTCPFCESEVKYLETQLVKRKSLGKKVLLTGIAVGLSLLAVEPASAQDYNCSDTDILNQEILDGDVTEDPSEEFMGIIIETSPEFPGGEQALKKYIEEEVHYPKEVEELEIHGTVYVRFKVNELGKVTDVEVVRGLYPLLDAEAVRVVKTLPDWIPANESGKNVSAYQILPIKF